MTGLIGDGDGGRAACASDGDAQALEGALSRAERERDEAVEALARERRRFSDFRDGVYAGIDANQARHTRALHDARDQARVDALVRRSLTRTSLPTCLASERDEARRLAARARRVLEVCGGVRGVHSDAADCRCDACVLVRDIPAEWAP